MAKRAKKVVVILGSPRKKGNSAVLAQRIASGAKAAGAEMETFFLHGMDIAPCCACEGCHQPGSKGCVIDDDMQILYPKLKAADAYVLATPIYWFTVSAQMKLFMDRCYALGDAEGYEFADKRVALAMAYADADPFRSGCVNAIRTFQDGFRFVGAEIAGMVYGSAWEAGEIRSNKGLMKKARELGKRLVST